jgi:hypothetical protein
VRTALSRIVLLTLLASPGITLATPVQFDWTGNPGPVTGSGYLVIDDSLFDGSSSQFIADSLLLGFSATMINPSASETWTLADLVPSTGWLFDSSTASPAIVGAAGGLLSTKDNLFTSFGAPGDFNSNLGGVPGSWSYVGALEPTKVSEPGTLALLLAGVCAMVIGRSRKFARTMPAFGASADPAI